MPYFAALKIKLNLAYRRSFINCISRIQSITIAILPSKKKEININASTTMKSSSTPTTTATTVCRYFLISSIFYLLYSTPKILHIEIRSWHLYSSIQFLYCTYNRISCLCKMISMGSSRLVSLSNTLEKVFSAR
jgi:hypothetical protein